MRSDELFHSDEGEGWDDDDFEDEDWADELSIYSKPRYNAILLMQCCFRWFAKSETKGLVKLFESL